MQRSDIDSHLHRRRDGEEIDLCSLSVSLLGRDDDPSPLLLNSALSSGFVVDVLLPAGHEDALELTLASRRIIRLPGELFAMQSEAPRVSKGRPALPDDALDPPSEEVALMQLRNAP